MMARFGMKWGIALVSLMLLGGCLKEDPAGPDTKNGKDLLTRGEEGADDGAGTRDTCILPPDSGWVCTMEYAPVCGVDGKTYGNRCMAAGAKVEVAKEGACEAKPVEPIIVDPINPIIIDPVKPIDPGEGWACLAVWDPVCGKDGKTYGNSCEARLAGVAYQGQCR